MERLRTLVDLEDDSLLAPQWIFSTVRSTEGLGAILAPAAISVALLLETRRP